LLGFEPESVVVKKVILKWTCWT